MLTTLAEFLQCKLVLDGFKGRLNYIDRLLGVTDKLKAAWQWVRGKAKSNSDSGDLEIPGLYRGGPAQAGRPYIIGERGPELFVPNVSGQVLPNSVFKAAAVASALALPAAADSGAFQFDKRPPIAASVPQQVIRQGDQHINITINATAGMDAHDIARAVSRELRRRDDEQRGYLHDGGDY